MIPIFEEWDEKCEYYNIASMIVYSNILRAGRKRQVKPIQASLNITSFPTRGGLFVIL